MSLSAYIERAVEMSEQKYKKLSKRELICGLIEPYSKFKVTSSQFTFDDGSEKQLVNLEGILPVYFKGVNYNIPVSIWLSENFPYTPPICFVKPTSFMVLSPSCSIINRNGKIVSLPLLQSWSYPKCDLSKLFRELSAQFGISPPVFSRCASQNSKMKSPTTTTEASNVKGQTLPYPITSQSPYFPPTGFALPTNSIAPVPVQSRPSSVMPNFGPECCGTVSSSNNIPDYFFRESLISAVMDKGRRKLDSLCSELHAEIFILRKTEQELLDGSSNLKSLTASMENEESDLNAYVTSLKKKSNELKMSIEKMSLKKQNENHGEIIITTAPVYNQILNCYAEDSAIQDLLYFLAEGQRKKTISLDNYLKFVRELARRQFFLRALMLRCRRVAGLHTAYS